MANHQASHAAANQLPSRDRPATLLPSAALTHGPDWRHRLLARYFAAREHPGRLRIIGILRRTLGVSLVRKQVSAGVVMELDPGDYLQREILVRGSYEGATLGLLDNLLINASGFLDVGAHMGLFTLRAAHALAKRGGRVVAIEPTPAHAAMLLRNAELSGLANIDLISCALSDFRSLVTMASPHHANTGGSRIKEENGPDFRSIPIRVSVVPAGDVVPLLPPRALDVVKVDVEGHEFRVLRSLLGSMEDLPANIIVEYVPEQRRYEGDLAWISELGYEILEVDGRQYLGTRPPLEDNLWLRLRAKTAGAFPTR